MSAGSVGYRRISTEATLHFDELKDEDRGEQGGAPLQQRYSSKPLSVAMAAFRDSADLCAATVDGLLVGDSDGGGGGA